MCLSPATGAHYAGWIYPDGSGSLLGSNILAIIKFSTWTSWGSDPAATNSVPLAYTRLSSVGTTNHIMKLTFNGSSIALYYDNLTTPALNASDTAYSSGGVSVDMWTYTNTYTVSVGHVIVTSP